MAPQKNELEEDYSKLNFTIEDTEPTEDSKEKRKDTLVDDYIFPCHLTLIRFGPTIRLLKTLSLTALILAVLSLFLFITPIDSKHIILLLVALLLISLVSFVILKITGKSKLRKIEKLHMHFYKDSFYLAIPNKYTEEFSLNPKKEYTGDFSALETMEESDDIILPAPHAWQMQKKQLYFYLPYNSIIDQAYDSFDRSTLIEIQVPSANRLLRIRIPDASLPQEDRNQLEARIFTKAERSLRAI